MKRPYLNKWERQYIIHFSESRLASVHNVKVSFRNVQREMGKTFNPYLNKIGLKIKGT